MNLFINKKLSIMNIDKYLNNVTYTDNGLVYKDNDKYKQDSNAVCYISEYSLEDLDTLKEQGKDLTDEEIKSQGIGYSRDMIREAIKERLGVSDNKINEKNFDDDVFEELSWQHVSTYLDEFEDAYLEELEINI
jgi:hypothetical protein